VCFLIHFNHFFHEKSWFLFQKSAQTPDKKPGRELAQWAEGFFCLDFLLLFYQEKNNSLRGNERYRTSHLNEDFSAKERRIFYIKRNELALFALSKSKKILHCVQNDKGR